MLFRSKFFSEDCAQSVDLEVCQPLDPWRKISYYWEENPKEEVLSVILPRPSGSEC